jgi:hypothetical protein
MLHIFLFLSSVVRATPSDISRYGNGINDIALRVVWLIGDAHPHRIASLLGTVHPAVPAIHAALTVSPGIQMLFPDSGIAFAESSKMLQIYMNFQRKG